MTKKQKIWLLVSSGMFLIPEILWSPVVNFYYELFLSVKPGRTYPIRDNFFQSSDNVFYLKILLLVQLVGLLLLLSRFFKSNTFGVNNIARILLGIIVSVLILATAFVLYFIYFFTIDIL